MDAFENRVNMESTGGISEKIGIRNLRFGDTVCSLEADREVIQVESNRSFHLEINGMELEISGGRGACTFRASVKKCKNN